MNTQEKFYRPVGDRFMFRDVELEVKATCRCNGCYFYENDHHQNQCALVAIRGRYYREEKNSLGPCSIDFRADDQSVIFKQVKE